MAVTFVAAGAIGAIATASTVNVPRPTCLADDILILQVYSQLLTVTINTPSGWTALGTQQNVDSATAQDDFRYAVFWKRAVAGDSGGTLAVSRASGTTTLLAGVISAWRGCLTSGSPFDTTTPAQAGRNTSADNIDYPAFDPTSTNCHVIYLGFYADDATSPPASFSNGGITFTRRVDVETSTGNDCSMFAYAGDSTGGALGAVSHATTATADSSCAGFVTALLPGTTTTPQTVGGVMLLAHLSSSVIPRFVAHGLSGGSTPSGIALKRAQKAPDGTITPSGGIATGLIYTKALTATISNYTPERLPDIGVFEYGTPTSAIYADLWKMRLLVVAGGITPTALTETGLTTVIGGTLASPAGTISPLKVIKVNPLEGVLGQGIAPDIGVFERGMPLTGTLVPAVQAPPTMQSVSGTLTLSGTALSRITHLLSGGLTPSSTLVKRRNVTLVAAVTPSGVVVGLPILFRSIDGTLVLAGILETDLSHGLGGVLAPTSALLKRLIMALGGTITQVDLTGEGVGTPATLVPIIVHGRNIVVLASGFRTFVDYARDRSE